MAHQDLRAEETEGVVNSEVDETLIEFLTSASWALLSPGLVGTL